MNPKSKKKYFLLAVTGFIIVLFLIVSVLGRSIEPNTNKSSTSTSHAIFSQLLSKHVDEQGMVNYQGFVEDSAELKNYLDLLASNESSTSWSEKEQLAYWINAYNAFTIQLIVEHYPVESIKDIGSLIQIPFINSVWDIDFIQIGTKKLSLNNIEHKILRSRFNEPRIHFAIVCASISCPKLRNEAYTATSLDMQLEEQAIDFINDTDRNKTENSKIEISKIFKWFKGDFTENGNLIEFLNKYSKTKIHPDAKISHLDYNWNLNEQVDPIHTTN